MELDTVLSGENQDTHDHNVCVCVCIMIFSVLIILRRYVKFMVHFWIPGATTSAD